ncbi:MAG: biotin/lipoyl-binding protein [Ruminiclostridium sp.]|nr:biotin/lipoyl-binding protein [Ruminiclostridium sp.]
MRRELTAALAAAAVLLTAGCSREKPAEAEINIPILEGDSSRSYKTAQAELYDLTVESTIAGTVEYSFADTLSTEFDANILKYNVKKGDVLKQGDVIAEFDSSALDYELRNQQIATDSAYSAYLSSGSMAAKLEYDQQAELLALVQYKRGRYNVTAPYDCVVTAVQYFDTGDTVEAGTPVVSVAKADEVYVAVDKDKDKFAFGMPVRMKFGTNDFYTGRVVMTPANGREKVLIAFDEGELERAVSEAGSIVSAGWATVFARTFSKHNALCIPSDAVMQYSGSTYCYISENGERARVRIETGDTVDKLTVVLSGLSEGDTVSY